MSRRRLSILIVLLTLLFCRVVHDQMLSHAPAMEQAITEQSAPAETSEPVSREYASSWLDRLTELQNQFPGIDTSAMNGSGDSPGTSPDGSPTIDLTWLGKERDELPPLPDGPLLLATPIVLVPIGPIQTIEKNMTVNQVAGIGGSSGPGKPSESAPPPFGDGDPVLPPPVISDPVIGGALPPPLVQGDSAPTIPAILVNGDPPPVDIDLPPLPEPRMMFVAFLAIPLISRRAGRRIP